MANLQQQQDIVLNIFVRLPVKSVLRFRCVSKAWCKLLKDPDFVKKHLNHAIERNKFSLMMLSFYGEVGYNEDTETCTLTYDPSLSTLSDPVHIDYPLRDELPGIEFWGTCNGLICGTCGSENSIVLWNPATGEFKKIPDVPIGSGKEPTYCKHAFGYVDEIDDYKVVSFVGFADETLCEVQIYTLKSNSWRWLENIPWGFYEGKLEMAQVSVNGATHWLASNESGNKVIASFDFKDERFNEMPLPRFCDKYISGAELCTLGGSLCLRGCSGGRTDVWVMKKYGVTDFWSKMFTINHDTNFEFSTQLVPLQFAKKGMVLLGYDTEVGYRLDLYDIKLGISTNFKAYDKRDEYYAATFVYVESLVTLDSGTYVALPEGEDTKGTYLGQDDEDSEEEDSDADDDSEDGDDSEEEDQQGEEDTETKRERLRRSEDDDEEEEYNEEEDEEEDRNYVEQEEDVEHRKKKPKMMKP